jgi:diguanylate cyclase (GGDEF)-like protein
MPGCAEGAAIDLAERLRRATEASVIACGAEAIRMTVSSGVATFPRHGRTAAELIKAADTALYGAKAAGRNRVGVPRDE